MVLLSGQDLSQTFFGKTLFENVGLGVEDGQRIGVLGPNGAGKSTLLKILAGKMEPEEGKVVRRKGLQWGFLEQSPVFKAGETILEALLSGSPHPDEAHAQAYEWIAKLDLNRFDENSEVLKLSGGWRKRVALARELMKNPELLFLDEPTNHLDVTSLLWLETFLVEAPFAVVMVTHDRLFLQRVCNQIWDLDPRNPGYLLNVPGDYVAYVETKELELAAQQRHEQVLKNTLRRETEWLRRGAKARQTKQKARIEEAHALADKVDFIEKKNTVRSTHLDFGGPDRSPKKMIEAVGISKSFAGVELFAGLDLTISPKTRLALLGDNGCGKTTLIRCLLGDEAVDGGRVKQADFLKVSYFEQHKETLDPELSVLKNLCPDGDAIIVRGQSVHVRSYLEKFLFFGPQVDLPVGRLSGGEQARLRLAQLMMQEAQILVLDEPTNDLDVRTLEILENALADFPGAVILVTHDRYFMDAVSNQILAFPPPGFVSRALPMFASYLQWEEWYEDESKKAEAARRAKAAEASGGGSGKKVKLSFKEKFELENMEDEITKLEAKLATLQEESQRPEVLSNSGRLVELHSEMAKMQADLDRRYQRWSELEAKSKNS